MTGPAFLATAARPRWILLALIALLAYSVFYFGPSGAYQALREGWPDTPPLDEQAFAGPERAYLALANLGEAGRAAYRRMLYGDFPFLVLNAVFQILLIFYAFSAAFPKRAALPWRTAAIPILAGICDFLENLAYLRMLGGFPDRQARLAEVAGVITGLKLLLALGSLALVLTGAVLLAWRLWRRRRAGL